MLGLLVFVMTSSGQVAQAFPPGISLENVTWLPNIDMMETRYNVPSLAACADICLAESSYCSSYTWHGPQEDNEFFSYVCTTFMYTGARVACSNCHSVDLKAELMVGECEPAYALGEPVNVTSAEACYQSCQDASDGCNYWTLTEYDAMDLSCQLYSTCPNVRPCETGYDADTCITGRKSFEVE